MKKFLFISLLFASVNAFSQTNIELADVSKHVGDSVKIQATIYGGKYFTSAKGSPTFLDVGAKYPKALLTLFINQDVREKFTNQPIEDFYKGKNVVISGVITNYKDKLEIDISDPAQIQESVKSDRR